MYLFIEMQYLITLYCGHNRIIQIQVSNFPRSVNENTTPNVWVNRVKWSRSLFMGCIGVESLRWIERSIIVFH